MCKSIHFWNCLTVWTECCSLRSGYIKWVYNKFCTKHIMAIRGGSTKPYEETQNGQWLLSKNLILSCET